MKSTTVIQNIQRLKQEIIPRFGNISALIMSLDQSGGRALLVGGAVRDLLLGQDVKDLDIEVHGIKLNQLEAILGRFGNVRLVGKQFGVLRIDGIDVDWSIPRTDSAGRKPKVIFDPHLSLHDAFIRRDLTVNAMGIDLLTYDLIDPFDGQKDLAAKILRAPDPHFFVQDPLRFFRVMQFVGRLEMVPDKELNRVCQTMDLAGIAPERIFQEFEKLFLNSHRPSLGIEWLRQVARLREILPQLWDTIGIQQEPSWHPEGDVYEHTKQAVDKAASLSYHDEREKLIVILAALCHDLGKVTTTRVIDGRIRAFGHDIAGIPLTYALLERVTNKLDVKEIVAKLVEFHMMPGAFIKTGAGRAAYKRLAKKLAPQVNCALLARVAFVDKCGRNPKKGAPLEECVIPDVQAFVEAAQMVGVLYGPEPAVLTGADLLDVIKPGRQMGRLLEKAYTIQIEESITDKKELKKRVLD